MNNQKDNLKLTDMLRNLPEHDPPRDLTPLVMASLAPKKLPLWRRLCLLVRTPMSVTITPFKLATALAACVLIIAVVFQLPMMRFETAVRPTDPQLVPVTFSLANNEARSVYLIGSFNGWNQKEYAMKLDRRSNRWILEISLPPGRHAHCRGSYREAESVCWLPASWAGLAVTERALIVTVHRALSLCMAG